VLGDLRVSTTEQKEDGISLDVQRERIVAYCKMFQHDFIAIYSDDHTGRDIHRAGFQSELARMVESDALRMSVSLDRISRSVGDWSHLLDTYFGEGGKYKFLAFDCAGMDPRTATGRMLLMMRAVIAACARLAKS
jgi:site-specific DNA recombinase